MKQLLLLTLLMPLACHGEMMPGGLTNITIDPNDPNVQFALEAINDYYRQHGDNATRTLVKVEKAQSQVVAGAMYYFTLIVTTGRQDDICDVQVWSRPWLPDNQTMQINGDPVCNAVAVTTAPPVGGYCGNYGRPHPIDPHSPEVQNALCFAVNTLNAQEDYPYYRKAVHIDIVTCQVVSGINFRFRGVQLAATDCAKTGPPPDLHNCAVSDNPDIRTCDFGVWWQAWMTPEYQLIYPICQPQ